MRLVAAAAGGDRAIDVRWTEDATVADLAGVVLDADDATTVFVDGQEIPGGTPLLEAGIVAGARLSLSPLPPAPAGAVELQVLSGPGAGSSVPLQPGDHVIGSGAGSDIRYRAPTVRSRHAALRVSVAGDVRAGCPEEEPAQQVGPRTLLDFGGPLLAVGEVARNGRSLRKMPGRRGTVAFNRPPRQIERAPAPSIPYPEALKPPSSTSRLSVVSLIVPVLFGITLAVLIHPRMALFALLGPVMMGGSWLEDRRRKRKYRKDSAAQDDEDLRRLRTDLERAAAAEVTRRHRAHPPVASLARWPGASSHLWERRPAHDDFMRLVVGYGSAPWRPPMEGNPAYASPAVQQLVGATRQLPRGPVPIDLRRGQVLGLTGARGDVLDLVRGLVCQAVVLHGPADLRLAVITDRAADWEWTAWLPHTLADGAAERRLLAERSDDRHRLVAMLTPVEPESRTSLQRPAAPQTPLTILVVDAAGLAEVDAAGIRHLLGGGGDPIAGIVLADDPLHLPSACNFVVEVRENRARITDGYGAATGVAFAGAEATVAGEIARKLAGFTDPDRREPGAELPTAVSLVDLVGGEVPSPASIADSWRTAGADPPVAGVIGVAESGPLVLDIVGDGPHGLLAGTTGSGKSELLRTLIASLALAVDPEHLALVLIDYKGGSAFDACAQLPHTVGLVTDLDDQLARRALQCLEAELRYREQRLRDAGADDLTAYVTGSPAEPLPRMLIVIDEFAALAKELPEFMDALVDIAARGRSLGVHLLLATQRPAGVIRDNVRANTNLRLALRVQDRADSIDVLGDPRAADIARAVPGRGYLRLGPAEVVPFQAALVTCGGGESMAMSRIDVRDAGFAMELAPFSAAGPAADGPTDLEQLVAAIAEAADLAGCAPPRRPWPEPLPELVELGDLEKHEPPTPTAVPVGLVDEPDFQRQRTMWWDPRQGSLALYGLTGAGTTSALGTIAISLAHRYTPDEAHLYVMDFDAGALSPLADLPHVGAVVGAAERERQVRLVRHLSIELDRRKRNAAQSDPLVVLMVDNFPGFSAAFDATADAPVREALHRVLLEGPGLGMVAALSGTRPNAIPLTIAGTIASKLVFRMADPLAAATFGLRRIPMDLVAGRAIHAASQRVLQVATCHPDGLEAAVATAPCAWDGPSGPQPIEELPLVVKSAQVRSYLRILEEDWWIPVGVGDGDLGPVGLPLGPGDHVLIAGEARSGRSSLLCAMAEVVASQRPDVEITAVALRRSPLRDVAVAARVVTETADLEAALEELDGTGGPHLVLIDDVDSMEASAPLRQLVASSRPDVRVVGAGRRDLKTQYNHWARDLCRSRVGVWLAPGPGLDGDLWSTPMPRHIPAGLPPGRGYLVAGGTVELMQAMLP